MVLKMFRFLSVVFFASTVVAHGALQVEECPGVDALIPVNVIVPSCAAPPCYLFQGQTYRVEIDFEILGRNTTTLNSIVWGILAGLELPWNGVKPNGCDNLVIGNCPMYDGDYFTYAVELKVETVYPVTPLTIKWQIRDDNEVPIFCFLLPAEIKPMP